MSTLGHLLAQLSTSPPADILPGNLPKFLANVQKFNDDYGDVSVHEFLAQAGGNPRGKLVEWTEGAPIGRMPGVVGALLNLPALQGAPHGVGGLCCVVA
jgi:hypothetical protein